MLKIAASAALFASVLSGHSALAQSQATFGDWSAGCDNVRRCSALGFSTDISGAYLQFERDAQPGAPAKIRLIADIEVKGKEILLEGAFNEPGFEKALPSPLLLKANDDDRFVVEIPAESLDVFRDALRKAATLTVRRADGKPISTDTPAAVISLKGSVAALRWIDDQQKRAGTISAFIAAGPAGSGTMPAIPALPVVRPSAFKAKGLGEKAPPAVVAAWKAACEDWDDRRAAKPDGYAIGPGVQLWEMPCSAGAYNFSSMYFLVKNGAKPQLLTFEQWTGREKGAGRFTAGDNELTNSSFDEATQALRFFSKGRGIGDCGSMGEYVWDGARFRMTEYKLMGECKGVIESYWHTLWRARVAK